MNQQYEWDRWLKRWNDLLLERLNRDELPYYSAQVVTAVEAGWLGTQGASEADIVALEKRLGRQFPPSFRQFLLTSNGFLQPGMIVPRLLAAHEVEMFIEVEKDQWQSWLDWRDSGRDEFDTLDGTDYFLMHLEALIVISEQEESGSGRFLLNPERVNETGEWEAYYYAHWMPGAVRYPSFWALMESEFNNLLNQ